MSSDNVQPPVERRRHDRADMLSTSLLLDLTRITVDPAYIEASARRVARGEPSGRPGNYAAWTLVVAIGLLGVTAFLHTRRGAPQAASVRGGLVARVQRLTAQADAGDRELAALREQVAVGRDRTLAASDVDKSRAEAVRVLELAAGAAAVTGSGVTVRIADAARDSAGSSARVQDRDLQRAVNVAWAAGAEAVAINGQRLGALTAIRQAGESILVDYRPVVSPYVVAVIGDPSAIEKAFATGDEAVRLRAVASSLGFEFDVRRARRLDLPPTGAVRTTLARPAASQVIEEGVSTP